jgi:hypothetical protein
MHLDQRLNTISTKKRNVKITKAQQKELEQGWRDRNVRLREMRLPKETFEQYIEWVYGKGKKEKRSAADRPVTSKTFTPVALSPEQKVQGTGATACENPPFVKDCTSPRPWVTGACTTKQTPPYTGEKILGIGIMHKSNLVPIFSNEEAVDISKMRR